MQIVTESKMLLTPQEAAATLSVSESTLYRLTKAGQVPAVRLGRAVRYDAERLRKWIATEQGA